MPGTRTAPHARGHPPFPPLPRPYPRGATATHRRYRVPDQRLRHALEVGDGPLDLKIADLAADLFYPVAQLGNSRIPARDKARIGPFRLVHLRLVRLKLAAQGLERKRLACRSRPIARAEQRLDAIAQDLDLLFVPRDLGLEPRGQRRVMHQSYVELREQLVKVLLLVFEQGFRVPAFEPGQGAGQQPADHVVAASEYGHSHKPFLFGQSRFEVEQRAVPVSRQIGGPSRRPRISCASSTRAAPIHSRICACTGQRAAIQAARSAGVRT